MFSLKKAIILITYAAILCFLLTKIDFLFSKFTEITIVLRPFIYGFVIAYILCRPYNIIFKKIFLKVPALKKLPIKVSKILSLIICYVIFFGFLSFLIYMVMPQIISSCTNLVEQLSTTSNTGNHSAISVMLDFLKMDSSLEQNILESLIKFAGGFEELIKKITFSMYDILTKFLSETYYWILGLVISIYMLSSKEKILLQLRKIKDAFLPQKFSKNVMEVSRLCHKKIGKFLIGQLLKSLIVAVLCFIGTLVLKTPYGLLISVIVGVTNVIPFFGPFFGAIPSIIIVLTVDHIAALWFGIFLFVLQQIDGNIIGPKILGNVIGLSGLWIIFGVIVGGGLFGFFGMIFGVPVLSVIYVVLGKHVNKKLYGENYLKKEA